MKSSLSALLLLAPALVAQEPRSAEGAPPASEFVTVTMDDLRWTTDAVPDLERRIPGWILAAYPRPEVRVEGAVEAWTTVPTSEAINRAGLRVGDARLSVRGPGTRGELWSWSASGPERFPFELVREGADTTEAAFLETRYLAYAWLHVHDLPGAAWFRHRKEATARRMRELGVEPPPFEPNLFDWRVRPSDLDRTFDLFTGGRALAENLALDDALDASEGGSPTVLVDSLEGITVPEIDWKPLIEGQDPELDPLAARLPADQHAVFFPSFAALVRVLDEARVNGAPILQLLDHSSEDAGTQARYERQLALPLDRAARLLGGALVTRVAVTGGDPYFRTGTDVAVLFESPNPVALMNAIVARQQEAAAGLPGAQTVSGTVGDLVYQGALTPDRTLCSYVARVAGDVAVTNSLAQLARLDAVDRGEAEALAALDEYVWFRARYPRGEREDAFVVVTDATIRRWASPRWRIAGSRRTRAAAWLAEGTAARLAAALDAGRLPEAGAARPGPYGTSDFLTPIGELDLDLVTQEEAEGYERFRRRYMGIWDEVFDPVGLRLVVEESSLEVDLTVRPLALQSDYRDLIELTQGAVLEPHAGDPHPETVLHFAMALGRESSLYRNFDELLSGTLGSVTNPLAWLGSDASVWVEDDPEFWRSVLESGDPEEYLEEHAFQLPVALRLPSNNPLRLAAFLTGARSFIEGAAPGLVRFTRREHEGRGYVAILPEDLEDFAGQPLAIYYASLPDAWIVSLREDVVQRAIDRHQAEEPAPASRSWLGESAAIRLREGFAPMLAVLYGGDWRDRRRELAWRALPILDEWRRLAPGVDPLAFHRDHFGVTLRAPDGGRYELDAGGDRTQCSVFGHPWAPGEGALLPPAVSALKGVELGVTFEEGDGLRARARIDR